MWVRLEDIISLISGQDLTTNQYNSSGGDVPYITGASNVETGNIVINRWTNSPKSLARKGDLLITCKGTIGIMASLTIDKVHIARQMMAIRGNSHINLDYIKDYLQINTNALRCQAKSIIPGITRKNILCVSLPLPPLNEQKRIVKKARDLSSLIDNLLKLVA